jgi:hypothetical protein
MAGLLIGGKKFSTLINSKYLTTIEYHVSELRTLPAIKYDCWLDWTAIPYLTERCDPEAWWITTSASSQWTLQRPWL